MKYTVEVVHLCTYIVWFVIGHVFAYLYNLDDYSNHPMDYETSSLSNVFTLTYFCGIDK